MGLAALGCAIFGAIWYFQRKALAVLTKPLVEPVPIRSKGVWDRELDG